MIDRFEIAKQYKSLDPKTFLHYLLSMDFVRAKREFVAFIKFLLAQIKRFAKYQKISHRKALNPFRKEGGVDQDYYDYTKTKDYKVQIESFLDLGLGIHDLYFKEEYQQIFEELKDFYGDDMWGAELTKDGFFKIPNVEHLITVIPNDRYEEMASFAKNDPQLKTVSLKDAVLGKTGSGRYILNMDNLIVQRYVLSKSLEDKKPEREGEDKKIVISEDIINEEAKNTFDEKSKPDGKPFVNEADEKEKAPVVKSTNSKWEKLDKSKDAETKKALHNCPSDQWGNVRVRFTAIDKLIKGQDDKDYFVKLPGVIRQDGNKWKHIGEIKTNNVIVRIPKYNTKMIKIGGNDVLSCTVKLDQKYRVCDENGKLLKEDGKPVDVYGIVVADQFELKGINVIPSKDMTEDKNVQDIDGEKMRELKTDDGFIFAYSDKRAVIMGYEGEEKNVTTPDHISIDGKDIPVDEIKDGAFAGTLIESLVISEGITEIRNGAFRNCENLKSISFPGSLTAIGDGILNGCILDEIKAPKTDVMRVEDGMFIFGDTVIKSAQKELGDNVRIPDDVKNIGEYAFAGAESGDKLGGKEIDLNAVQDIGRGAFQYTTFSTVKGTDKLENIHSLAFHGSDVKDMDLSRVKEIGEQAFSLSAITEAKLSSIERLGEKAFENAYSLKNVEINAKNLDKEQYNGNTFDGCIHLADIKWENLTPEEEKRITEYKEKDVWVNSTMYMAEQLADTKRKAISDYSDQLAGLKNDRESILARLADTSLSPLDREALAEALASTEEAITSLESFVGSLSGGLDTNNDMSIERPVDSVNKENPAVNNKDMDRQEKKEEKHEPKKHKGQDIDL